MSTTTDQSIIATMVRSFAEIIERMVQRHDDQGAEHERKLAEHRASFGARTSADAKIIEGLRADVEDLRNRLNSLGIQAAKQANIALGMVEGEGLLGAAKRVVKERDGLLTQVQDQRAEIEALTALTRNHQANRNTMRLYEAAMELCEGGMVPSEQIIKLRGSVNTLQRQLADTAERAAFGQLVVAPRDQLIENDELRNANTKLRAEVSALQERLRATIQRADFAQIEMTRLKAQTTKRSHPVKDGEYVRRTKAACAHFGHVAKVLAFIEPCTYEVQCIEGRGIWYFHNCEPCDPPADHDTPAGKEAAEAASKIRPADSACNCHNNPPCSHCTWYADRGLDDPDEAPVRIPGTNEIKMVRKVPQ